MVATEAYRILIIHLFTYIPPILLHILFLLVILIPNVLFWSPFLLFFSLLPLLVFSLSLSPSFAHVYRHHRYNNFSFSVFLSSLFLNIKGAIANYDSRKIRPRKKRILFVVFTGLGIHNADYLQ